MTLKTRLEKLEKIIILKGENPNYDIKFVSVNEPSFYVVQDVQLPRLSEDEYVQWNETYKQMDENSVEFKNWIDNLTYSD